MLRRHDTILRLPLPVKYREALTDRLEELTPPPIEIGNVDNSTLHLAESETVTIGKFTRQFLKPDARAALRSHQMLSGADGLHFWTINAPSLVQPFDQRLVSCELDAV